MKIRFLLGLVGFLFLATFNASTYADLTAANTEKFISVADIHFNPFAECKLSPKPCDLINKLRLADYRGWDAIFAKEGPASFAKIGNDTNYPLFKSALAKLHDIREKEQARFVLVLGDSLAHQFHSQYVMYSHDTSTAGYQTFIKKTLQFMTYQLHEALPNIDIYPLVGNNDSYSGDYNSVPNGSFYRDTAQIWATTIFDQANKNNLLNTFPTGGYYSISLPGNHHRILMLNSVLFSTNSKGQNIDKAAKQELSWLHAELIRAKKENARVIIAFHIPVGIDVYKTLKSGLTTISEFWKPQYSDTFKRELKTFSPIIAEILPAHIHMDAFQFITVNDDTALPINFTPAISPIYGNNPGFKVFSYNAESLKFNDYSTYYLPLSEKKNNTWLKEYSFNQIYQPNCKNCDLLTGMLQLAKNNSEANYYKQFYAVSNNTQSISFNNAWIPYYWCNLREITLAGYKSCIEHA